MSNEMQDLASLLTFEREPEGRAEMVIQCLVTLPLGDPELAEPFNEWLDAFAALLSDRENRPGGRIRAPNLRSAFERLTANDQYSDDARAMWECFDKHTPECPCDASPKHTHDRWIKGELSWEGAAPVLR